MRFNVEIEWLDSLYKYIAIFGTFPNQGEGPVTYAVSSSLNAADIPARTWHSSYNYEGTAYTMCTPFTQSAEVQTWGYVSFFLFCVVLLCFLLCFLFFCFLLVCVCVWWWDAQKLKTKMIFGLRHTHTHTHTHKIDTKDGI